MLAKISAALQHYDYDRVAIVTDAVVHSLTGVGDIVIPTGEEHKTLATAMEVWEQMEQLQLTRHSIVVAIGGGVVTDLAGFCAACFKRGIRHINVPTTLLAAVDAADGGKTGVNFGGLKNNIGVFHQPLEVVVADELFPHLSSAQLRSGYAEMLKHGLLHSAEAYHRLLSIDLNASDVWQRIGESLPMNIRVKTDIVLQDPLEQGARKALNLGHTAGHAIESLSLRLGHPMPHGYAVLYGLVAELYLSHVCCGFPKEELTLLVHYMKSYYGSFQCPCRRMDELLELMHHDKKNDSSDINFTLLQAPGHYLINQYPTVDLIRESLEFLSSC